MIRKAIVSGIWLALLTQAPAAKGPARLKPGTVAPDFTVRTTDGKDRNLATLRDEKRPRILVVVFWSPTCPWSRAWCAELSKIAKEFDSKNVRVVAVDSNDPNNKDADNNADSAKDVARFAKEKSLAFEVYFDSDQKAADLFGAQTTPDVFVIGLDGKIAYTGRVNDMQNPAKPADFKKSFLRNALEQLVANKSVPESVTPPAGFGIRRPKK